MGMGPGVLFGGSLKYNAGEGVDVPNLRDQAQRFSDTDEVFIIRSTLTGRIVRRALNRVEFDRASAFFFLRLCNHSMGRPWRPNDQDIIPDEVRTFAHFAVKRA